MHRPWLLPLHLPLWFHVLLPSTRTWLSSSSFSNLIPWRAYFFPWCQPLINFMGMTPKYTPCDLIAFLNSGSNSPITCRIFPLECPYATLNSTFKNVYLSLPDRVRLCAVSYRGFGFRSPRFNPFLCLLQWLNEVSDSSLYATQRPVNVSLCFILYDFCFCWMLPLLWYSRVTFVFFSLLFYTQLPSASFSTPFTTIACFPWA